MGYDDDASYERILFDIETVPLGEAGLYLEDVEAPSNYRDPLKIEEYIRGKQREQLERAALDVDLCRVVAIGSMLPDSDQPNVQLAVDEKDEREMLELFFTLAQQCFFVGFNILDFDLPVLLRRALYLNVDVPYVALDRYRHPRVLDVLQKLTWNGKLKYRSQSFYCRRFGLPVEDDEHEGSDVPALVASGRIDALVHHVRCDVLQVRALAIRLGLWPTAGNSFAGVKSVKTDRSNPG